MNTLKNNPTPTGQRLGRLATLSALAMLGLAACGGGGGDDASVAAAPSPTVTPTPSPAPAPGPTSAPAPTPAPSPQPPAPAPATLTSPTQVTTIASGLDRPWGMAFLPAPDGRYLVTERPGRLRLVGTNGSLTTVSGTPAVQASGQGGLLDIALDPQFSSNRLVYLSYAESGSGGNGLAVARGTLSADGTALSGVQRIYQQLPKVSGTDGHYGGRIVFAPDGKLFIAMGDRQNTSQQGFAQDLTRGNGKVARINADGSIPSDNPTFGRTGTQPGLWSYGHRNPQGAAIHPATGELWAIEHGPQGGDELNVVRSGRNYGWPLISYGCEYGSTPPETCTPVGGASSAPGMEQPVTYWVPFSMAPSGLMFYTGTRFTAWQGKAFAGALGGKSLWKFDIDQPGAVICTPRSGQTQTNCGEVALVKGLNKRIRDVRQAPDGSVFVLTDEGGNADSVIRLH